MPRRRPLPEEHENHDRWLVSYADFITLLFAFFVVMYAVSTVNEGKYRVLSDSLVSAFRNVTVNSQGIQVVAAPNAPSPPQVMAIRKPSKVSEERRQSREKMRHVARDLLAVLAPLVKDGHVRVTETARGVTLEINASVVFAPGDAQVGASAVRPLRAVAEVLAPTDFAVIVEGHTDDTPISTAQFPSNWELSVVRASSVTRLFAEAGLDPRRLTVTGYGEQRPLAGNTSAEGRARNRRVSILIESPDLSIPQEIPVKLPEAAEAIG
jgi:chemotaxis protein MotB